MYSCQRLPVEIVGLGFYLPERTLTNHDLERMVETSDEWIVQRTGIRTRHMAAEGQATSDLAVEAARKALDAAGLGAGQLDAIIVATVTSDYVFPATACIVQAAIGAENAVAFDLQAACSGFVYALTAGASMVASGVAANVMVIGAETLSRLTDYADRGSCILFGDGAGAAIVAAACNGGELIYSEMGCDGSQPEVLYLPAGGSRRPASHQTVDDHGHYIHLQGREVFKRAVTKMSELLLALPERTGIALDEIKMVIPHQSNFRIIKSALERSGLEVSRAYMNLEHVGNTSAASIPLAMGEALERGLIERGDLILMIAFGGGLTWGISLLRY